MDKVENIKRPLKIGEFFLVPCIVKTENVLTWELEGECEYPVRKNIALICPVFNHPHSDKENGQLEPHYHTDYRFFDKNLIEGAESKKGYRFYDYIRFYESDKSKGEYSLEYFILPVVSEFFIGITPVELIKKSKLKHKCIHKGKCPHRGFDLSQVAPIDGEIKCPLHGLRFNSTTKKMITETNTLIRK